MSTRIVFQVILLLLLAVVSPLRSVAADNGLPDTAHHKNQISACVECHGNNHLVTGNIKVDDCTACHEKKMKSTAFIKVAAVDEMSGVSVDTTAPSEVTNGMSLPMYYEKSRLGAEPDEMILIPAGKFIMGSDNRLPDEGPQHVVDLPAYLIDKYEVTNLQYKSFIDATGKRSPNHFRNRTFPDGKVDHPVTFVSWYDAKAYCEWAGKRLPSEQEWEKAARGTDGRTFPWGDEFALSSANTPVRWESLKLKGDTTPVGAFEGGKSPYGLYDMSGNVWEWTQSWYMPHPGNTRPSENYGKIYKLLKGGSWWDCSFYKCGISAPVFNRSFFNPKLKNSSFGFRCARDVS